MTDRDLVLRKLTVLLEHVARVRRRRPEDLAAFEADVDLQDATTMSLLVSIQEAIDVALHVACDSGWGVPASYAESFELLAHNGVLDPELAQRLIRMSAVRNRIAHGYASIDLARLWGEPPSGLEALESFATAVADWLGNLPEAWTAQQTQTGAPPPNRPTRPKTKRAIAPETRAIIASGWVGGGGNRRAMWGMSTSCAQPYGAAAWLFRTPLLARPPRASNQ